MIYSVLYWNLLVRTNKLRNIINLLHWPHAIYSCTLSLLRKKFCMLIYHISRLDFAIKTTDVLVLMLIKNHQPLKVLVLSRVSN